MKTDDYYIKLEEDGYFETIDKRTKDYREYKEWKSSNYKTRIDILREGIDDIQKKAKESNKYKAFKSNFNEKETIGLGDVVEKITEATGIKKIVKAIAGDDCGCDGRKEKFNKSPFRWNTKKINCISEEGYKWVLDVNLKRKTNWTAEDRVTLVNIYNQIFKTKVKPTRCSSCVNSYKNKILQYLEIYNS